MSVHFCVAGNSEEALISEHHLEFDEELHEFLYKNRYRLPDKSDLLIGLDPYGDRILGVEDIRTLIEICGYLREEFNEAEVKSFANKLLSLCELALEHSSSIVALGD